MGDNNDPEEPIDNLEEVSRLKSQEGNNGQVDGTDNDEDLFACSDDDEYQEGNNGHADSMSDDDKDLFASSEDDKEENGSNAKKKWEEKRAQGRQQQGRKKWGHPKTKEEEDKNPTGDASPPPTTVPEGDGSAVQTNVVQ
jgi:hypothetical protein